MAAEPGRALDGWLAALLAFTVLAFGSTSYWAKAIFAAWTATLFTAWWISEARSRPPAEFEPGSRSQGLQLGGLRFQPMGLGVPALLFGLVILLQFVPLPPAIRHLLAPGRAGLERTVSEVLGGEEPAAGAGWEPLSVDPGATLDSLMLFVAYAALFTMVSQRIDSGERLLRMCRFIVGIGLVVALAGLAQDLAGAEQIYGFKELRYGGAPYGPFVNHNHFDSITIITIAYNSIPIFNRKVKLSCIVNAVKICINCANIF